jgi:hypothetical protein
MQGIWEGRRWCGRSKEVVGCEGDEEVAGGAASVEEERAARWIR